MDRPPNRHPHRSNTNRNGYASHHHHRVNEQSGLEQPSSSSVNNYEKAPRNESPNGAENRHRHRQPPKTERPNQSIESMKNGQHNGYHTRPHNNNRPANRHGGRGNNWNRNENHDGNGVNKAYGPPRFARSQQNNAPKQSTRFNSDTDRRLDDYQREVQGETDNSEQLTDSFKKHLNVSHCSRSLQQRPRQRGDDEGPERPHNNIHIRRNNFADGQRHHGPHHHHHNHDHEHDQSGPHRRQNHHHRNRSNEIKFAGLGSKDKKNESQREIMDELLRKAKYECIVCCEPIRITQKTWNCGNCFNVFHLKCIQTWARTSNNTETEANQRATAPANGNADSANASNQAALNNNNRRHNRQVNSDWRCPTCQNIQKKFPYAYYCFCGKVKEPEQSHYHVPHSCGNTCSRPLSIFNSKGETDADTFPCTHKCTLSCHPGKCAPCSSKIERTCNCSKTKIIMNCVSKISEIQCDQLCNKKLSCGKHYCDKRCHFGDCDTCQETFDLTCFCGKETKSKVPCTTLAEQFSCEQKCSKLLACGFHKCNELCHPGDCTACPFDPATVKTCPCGTTQVTALLSGQNRLLCIDPIPVCTKTCNKRLICGTDAEPHFCTSKCHSGACPPCALKSVLRCECGANSQKFDCKDITSERFKCKRRCNKKLSCGRHKCLNECCTDKEHICRQVCGRKLDCGTHQCTEPCHSYCKSCPNVIWTEVYCNCGDQVLYPPLPCGTKRPACDKPCARVHPCPHPPKHQCHDDAECPPCTEFVDKECYGGHEILTTVPCYQSVVSCGRFCKKTLPCKIHSCIKVCHANDCPPCSQKCTKARQGCEHPCGLSCHQETSPNCPESQCKETVKIYCKCKLLSQNMPCYEVNDPKKFQASVDSLVTRYRFDAITLNEIKQMVKYNSIHQLDCDDNCAKEKRNRDLAEALGIEGYVEPSVKYSDSLKEAARANPQVVLNIHDKLVMLLRNYRKANTKTMSYSFPAMNRTGREIIHNLAAAFGCKTESVDREPNRSVIVTAVKTSIIPEVSVLEAINLDVNQLRPKQSVVKAKTASEEDKDKKVIDYFNFDGQD